MNAGWKSEAVTAGNCPPASLAGHGYESGRDVPGGHSEGLDVREARDGQCPLDDRGRAPPGSGPGCGEAVDGDRQPPARGQHEVRPAEEAEQLLGLQPEGELRKKHPVSYTHLTLP